MSASIPDARSGGRLMMHDALFSLRGEQMRVELDKKSLFALASDTRVEILRALQPMRRTVTQLSDSLGIDKAAVHRHLKKMEEGGLVKRYEDHGFVYYGLSWKARDLMSPNENTKIIILLSMSWIFCIAVVFLLLLSFSGVGENLLPASRAPGGSNQTENQMGYYSPDIERSLIAFVFPAAAIAVVAALMAYWGLRGAWKQRQKSTALDKATPSTAEEKIIDDD